MQITAYVSKTGVKSGTSERTGKAWSRPWMILEGLFVSPRMGVNVPDEGRKIVADVVSSQTKFTDKNTGDDKYRTQFEMLGWRYSD